MANKLKTNDKLKKTYTKDMIIRNIAEKCKKDISTVRNVYNTMEDTIVELLSHANPDVDITLRLFEGITIDSTYVPEQTKMNNLTGKIITSTSKIKPKVNVTRNYRDKLTAYSK